MNDVITAVIAAILGGGTIMGLVKAGYIKGSISIGKNGNGTEAIKASLEKLENNDLVHIDAKLDKLIDKMDKLIEITQENLFISKELRK